MMATDLNQVLDDTIQLLESQLHNTRIGAGQGLAGDLPSAPGNAPKLQQVFMNLILNARDAMPQRRRLEISTACEEGSILITFRDTGEGSL
jgi:signal transduction histidine kinase